MVEYVKKKLENHPCLFRIAKQILELKYFIFDYVIMMLIVFKILQLIRKLTNKNKYNSLKKYKNLHKGERCFVVATGPSLTIDDLEKLKNEKTFSVNTIVNAFEKTPWRPTYYGIFDIDIYKKVYNEILKIDEDKLFIGDELYNISHNRDKIDANYFPIYMFNHKNKLSSSKYKTKFSNDIYSTVYDGGTIIYCVLQIAAYMGFKEIYLLGADCNYYGQTTHFNETAEECSISNNNADKKQKFADNRYFRMIKGYEVAKQFAKDNGIKIYNATRGGMLELFERANLDDII